jgi:hypothetical protein
MTLLNFCLTLILVEGKMPEEQKSLFRVAYLKLAEPKKAARVTTDTFNSIIIHLYAK